MSKDLDWAELERELLARISQDFSQVLLAKEDQEDGMRLIFIFPRRLLTPDEVLSICVNMVPIIRRRIPERADGWAAGVVVKRISGPPMGCYYLGWTGHADEWQQFDRSTDHADWLALFQQLGRLLSALDVEGRGERNFSLRDEDNGLPRQGLSIRRIEFLTPDLVANIQELLRNGYPDWCVEVHLTLPYSDRIGPEGIDIWSDEIVEHWDRRHLEKRLGERLKI